MKSTEKIYLEWLVLRCRRNDRAAFEELIRHFEDRLFYYIRQLVASEEEAWDVLQDTWLKVLRSIRRLRNPQSLSAWIYRVARNTAMSRHRSNALRRHLPAEAAETQAVVDGDQPAFDNAEQVHYGLRRLSLPHREVLTLFFLEDMTLRQIAEVLDVSPGTVKSRLYYARNALNKVLSGKDKNNE